MPKISLEKIESIAPDQASLVAARKLVKPAAWSGLSSDSDGLVWGECQGSGSSPYRVVISESDAGYKCSCPSRKFPCKHNLALMWMRAEGKVDFKEAQSPDWVQDWVRRRRPSSARAEASESEVPPSKSLSQATSQPIEEADPKAEARAAGARERARREREEAVLAGLDDLGTWLVDQVDAGIAGFAQHASKSCRAIARRLVDAKAPGLASRLDMLPNRIYSIPEHTRGEAALEQLGQLHLLAEAYRKQEALTPDLRADVRREVGWTQSRESLLDEEGALCVSGRWRVVGTVSEVQPDRLRRLETWLWHESTAEEQRVAVLIDFVPVASGQTRGTYRTGESVGATLVYYPSARPLRALIKEMSSPTQDSREARERPEANLSESLALYEDALSAVPWINIWPIRFRDGRIRRHGERLFVCASEDDDIALPILASQTKIAIPLLSIEKIDGFGLWDGYFFRLCSAQTPLGPWVSE